MSVLSIVQGGGIVRQDEEIIELPLLLSVQQWADLEQAARLLGLTGGELIRLLLRNYVRSLGIHSAECFRSAPTDEVAVQEALTLDVGVGD